MAKLVARPERVCGIHFFNPAPVLPLVEVVRPITASDETIHRALKFVRSVGKDGVQVLDRAGFIVNALLFPYLNNAIRMLEAGTASMEDIDTAMKGGCNFPMGPFALLDLVGLDTSLSILTTLHESFGDANFSPRPMLRDLVAQGRLGRKTKAGFYVY
jgi:3-hydroxybutyryl-CoA dehydrogenase